MRNHSVYYAIEKLAAILRAEQHNVPSPRFSTNGKFFKELESFSNDHVLGARKAGTFKQYFKPSLRCEDHDASGVFYSKFPSDINTIICDYLNIKYNEPKWLHDSADLFQNFLIGNKHGVEKKYLVVEHAPDQPMPDLGSIRLWFDPQKQGALDSSEYCSIFCTVRLGITSHFESVAEVQIGLRKVILDLILPDGSTSTHELGLEKLWDYENLSGSPTARIDGQPPEMKFTLQASTDLLQGGIQPRLGEVKDLQPNNKLRIELTTQLFEVGAVSERAASRFDGIADEDSNPINDISRSKILARLASMERFEVIDGTKGEVLIASHEVSIKNDENV